MQNIINLAVDSNFARVQEGALEIALSHARGCFQRGLIMGYERLSLALLKGKAKKYGAHYANSRDNLLSRLHCDSSIVVRDEIGKHNRRELFIGVA